MDEINVDETKYGYVYRITNLINCKTYIGQHKIIKDEKWMNYMGSGTLITLAIHKHGIESFKKELICYTDSKSELDNLEKYNIQKELSKGKAEYNIMGSEEAVRIKIKDLNFTDEELLKWYFEDLMSYTEIAYKLGCSMSSLFEYMKKFREIDERFKNIRQGDSRGKNFFSEQAIQKALEITHKKVECENCTKSITYVNYQNHLKACLEDDYYDGHRKHECAHSECLVVIYKKNTYCQTHFLSDGFVGVSTPESVKKGGLVAAHNRWHVKRNTISETCELCQKDKAE